MTISSVAPTTSSVGTSGSSTGTADTGLGALFAGLLGFGTTSGDPVVDASAPPEGLGETAVGGDVAPDVDPDGRLQPATLTVDDGTGTTDEPTEPTTELPVAGAVELLAAAQFMAAAQVVPVTPVLAAALSLSAAAPIVAGPPAGVPTGSTAVSAGDPVTTVPSSAVPLAAPAATATTATVPTSADPAPAASVSATVSTSTSTSVDSAPANSVSAASGPADAGSVVGAMTASGGRPDTGAGQPRADQGPRGHDRAEPVSAPSGPHATSTAAIGAPARAEAAPGPTGSTQQVTGQVFPEVTRLVSRGDGTRRITLKLSPEALGEVRVVLTVRDGDVQVRMVGSEQAQQALRAGAPELQRLLDLAGATSSSVVVGDQGSAPEPGFHSGPGTDRNPDHRTAGTRDGDTSARDGYPGGPQQRPSSDPTATRGGTSTGMAALSGVDMTM